MTHLQHVIRKLPLVANQHDYHVRVGMLTSVLQPGRQVDESLASRYIVDQQGARGSPIVGARN